EGVLVHADHHVQVAGRAACEPRLALARDLDLAPGVDARGDLEQTLVLADHRALAAAVLALAGDHLAGAAAAPAGARHAEEALLERHLAVAVALAAAGRRRPGSGAAARAGRARLRTRDLDVRLGAEDGFLERQLEVVAQVGAAPGAAAAAPAEHVAEAE